MERGFDGEYDSVDLTEDEDSRGTIADVPPVAKPPLVVNSTNPPPLTPIGQFTSFQNNNLNKHVMNVPKLKKIRRSVSNPNQQVSTKSSNASNSTSETVCLDSDEDESTEGIPASKKFPVDNNSKISGKVVIIKKNNKYYRIIIPHNVMPTINQSEGPVVINIPGVGPLVIKIDPKAKEQTSTNNTLEPFSLNFDELMDTVTTQPNLPTVQKSTDSIILKKHQNNKFTKENLLIDTKFCWVMNKTRYKNNRYSYNFRDFWGFTKMECYKARKCFNLLENYLHKKTRLLEKNIKMHDCLKRKLQSKNNVKPVKISEIVGKSVNNQVFVQRLHSEQSVVESRKTYIPETFHCYNIHNAQLPPNTVITHINDYDDLLLTKKVVILKGNEEETTKRNWKFKKANSKKKQKMNKRSTSNNNEHLNFIKPCFVQITRDEDVEQLSMKSSSKPSKESKLRSPSRLSEIKNKECIPSLSKVWSIFHSKLINNETLFKKEIAFIKPLLILNEYNFNIINYTEEFTKSNIIYSVNKQLSFPRTLLCSPEFLRAVETRYVKLVREDLLFSFLKGEIGPKSNDSITFA